MKILVTGGSGFLGKHVTRFFEADDFSRRSGRNILNLQDVAAVADYDMVIHLAAHLDKSREGAEQVFLTNVEGTVNLLRQMRKDSVFVFASTKDVYGRFADNFHEVPETCPTTYSGQSALEWSKLIAERYVEYYANTKSFRSCIFRLSTVYAPMSEGNTPNFVTAFADAINKGEPIALPGDGKPIRDVLHVDDLSGACKAFADSGLRHGLYNLGGGGFNAFHLSDLILKMEKVSGLQAVISKGDQSVMPVPLNYITDLTLITQELGWKPEIELEAGLKTLFV
jgi:nucleoside-diphosphate-sugar epimerase